MIEEKKDRTLVKFGKLTLKSEHGSDMTGTEREDGEAITAVGFESVD